MGSLLLDHIKHVFLLFPLTFLAVNSIAQSVTVVGTVRDFETGEPLSDAMILEDRIVNGYVIDTLGNFQLTLEGSSQTIKCSCIGYYELIVKNIPTNIDTLELADLRMVTNYSSHLIVEFGPDVEPDMKKFKAIKNRIENEYQLTIKGEVYKPKILEHDIVFDLNKPTGAEKEDP